ncbi:GlxA family transcriptional regulator [Ferrimonas senticii]|uniref:GlxA family transcriptional regulator n=1 Tax=Ferrimonas senticii TaxID=394566 RepID=UPI000410B41A|nr:helix-turn-helix domain-containing protein [Ferrimonas senticii]
MTVRFLLLPLPGFTLLPFAAFVDKLRFSADEADHSRQHHCHWQVAAISERQHSSCGVEIVTATLPSAASQADYLGQFDYLVLFGGRPTELNPEQQAPYRSLLRNFSALNRPIVAIDNGVFLLANQGLLEGRKVAVHWRHQAQFNQRFPRIEIVRERLYCHDGNRISCAGGSAAADLAVSLLQSHLGSARAHKGLADMLIDRHRSPLQAQPTESLSLHSGDRLVNRAINLMLAHLATPLTIEALAQQLGVSRRQLDRRFISHAQHSCSQHYLQLRLQHADWLLQNSDWPLAAIADDSGFCNAEHLSRQFLKQFGIRPKLRRSIDAVDTSGH